MITIYTICLFLGQWLTRFALTGLDRQKSRWFRYMMHRYKDSQKCWDHLYKQTIAEDWTLHQQQHLYDDICEQCLAMGIRPPQFEGGNSNGNRSES